MITPLKRVALVAALLTATLALTVPAASALSNSAPRSNVVSTQNGNCATCWGP